MNFFLARLVLVLLIFSSAQYTSAQSLKKNTDLKSGYKLFKKGQYVAAGPYYERLVKSFPQFAGFHFKLAYCYLNTEGKSTLAVTHFREACKRAKVLKIDSKEVEYSPIESFYHFAHLSHSLEKFDDAFWGYNYYEHYGTDAERKLESVAYSKNRGKYKEFVRDLYGYQVKKVEDASQDGIDESSPFVVMSPKDSIKTYSIYGLPLVYYINDMTMKKRPMKTVLEDIEIGEEFIPVCIGNENKHVIFRKLNTNRDYDLFICRFGNNQWSKPEPLPVNERGSNETHAFLSRDEKIIYFISNRDNGFGGFDIWTSKFNGKRWDDPVNLGSKVNSPANETSLFADETGKNFYFSSNNSAKGFGGYDIYKVQVEGQNVSFPELLKYPINSAGDDIDFKINENKYAVFASNRGLKDFDIYYIDYGVPVKMVQLVGNVPDEVISKSANAHTDVVVFDDLLNVIEKIKNSDLESAVSEVETMETAKAIEVISSLEMSQAVNIIETMNTDKRTELLDGMEVEKAVDIFDAVSMSTAVDAISSMNEITSVKIVENMESEKALSIMNQLDINKTTDILEGMEVEKAVDIVDEFTTTKAIDIIDKMDVKSAAAIMDRLSEAKTLEIIEGVDVDKAVGVLSGIDNQKADRIVNRFKEIMETDGENSKVIAIIKSYFADQVKIKESVIFKNRVL